MPRRHPLVLAVAALLVVVAGCGSSGGSGDTVPATPTSDGGTAGSDGAAGTTAPPDGSAIDEARCAANRDAGTITYLSGFDFAATASIVEVLVADARGYYDDLCLDVELKSSFSTANYPLIAAGEAQFASGGSYTEVLDYATANDADLVTVAVEGQTGIDALLVKQGDATTLDDLRGTTIGVKGKMTSGVQAMLSQAGLREGTDYQTVLIDGFDPTAHIALPNIVGFPVYKSNEPGQLERAGIPFTLFDPAEMGIPGSFGILYTTRSFLDAHPQAATDFMRATMRGLAEAVADPQAAAELAVQYINGHGNPNYLSAEGEVFRWNTESEIVVDSTPAGRPLGLIAPEQLQAEVDAYAAAGVFDDAIPVIDGSYDMSLLEEVYGSGTEVIWPG